MSFWVRIKASYDFGRRQQLFKFSENGQKSCNEFEKSQVPLE